MDPPWLASVAMEQPELVNLVLQLTDAASSTRENALLELSKKREEFPDLAPILWHSFATIAALLQEIVSIYPALSPPTARRRASMPSLVASSRSHGSTARASSVAQGKRCSGARR